MGKKVVCVCPECIQHRVLVNGERVPGQKVTPQRRRLDEIAAAAKRSPDYAKATKSHPVGVEELFDEEEDDKGQSGGSPSTQQSPN
jgi:hypothetical protein